MQMRLSLSLQPCLVAGRKMADRSAEEDARLQGEVFKVSGPLVVASHMSGSFMHELVRVGPKRIVVRAIPGSRTSGTRWLLLAAHRRRRRLALRLAVCAG